MSVQCPDFSHGWSCMTGHLITGGGGGGGVLVLCYGGYYSNREHNFHKAIANRQKVDFMGTGAEPLKKNMLRPQFCECFIHLVPLRSRLHGSSNPDSPPV